MLPWELSWFISIHLWCIWNHSFSWHVCGSVKFTEPQSICPSEEIVSLLKPANFWVLGLSRGKVTEQFCSFPLRISGYFFLVGPNKSIDCKVAAGEKCTVNLFCTFLCGMEMRNIIFFYCRTCSSLEWDIGVLLVLWKLQLIWRLLQSLAGDRKNYFYTY